MGVSVERDAHRASELIHQDGLATRGELDLHQLATSALLNYKSVATADGAARRAIQRHNLGLGAVVEINLCQRGSTCRALADECVVALDCKPMRAAL
eukprot:CAMPEP_0181200946 /NCGR_PEP_ID=MMETSP1096-20121128/18045_1 /TAXON_ID=156174 ORGANISM="Chrysochromulina ericina, Strain CCMP281" /NCGR_SAMPLE_ID=MMETSP1096 /ASSEMBLY_ACC=CAM_ASM_000453 /LENGTH=96 /DNA_ID=CAMNT_0023291357 /DNA_START=753 /DNA_END=1041 /DNA_ORIENTATION=-